MKPRTKLERQLAEWSAKLPPLTKAQRKYAYGLFDKVGYYWKSGKVWCQCCGLVEYRLMPELAVSLELDDEVCPECGANLRLRHWSEAKKNYSEAKYFSTVRAYGDWMVVRTFEVMRHNQLGKPTKYEAHEIYQNWVSPEGREFILGKRYTRSPFHLLWDYDSPMDIKHHNHNASGYYEMEDLFDTSGNYYYPRATVTPLLKRNGWDARILKMRVSLPDAIRQLLKNPVAETIAKRGQWEVFRWMMKRGNYQVPYLYALNICHRHGYTIRDASMWFDYMDLLLYFNLDTHNPKYVCPENLIAEHDKLERRKSKAEARRKLVEKQKEIASAEKAYRKAKARFLGILITDGQLEIRPIPTVKDVFEEGQAMHHCVYTNDYYKRADCLLLSARLDGERVETVEVSLRTFDIVQSRGVCNKNTEYHERIVRLVKENMNLIKQAI